MFVFFFNDTATTEIYTLSLHDALPISCENLRMSSGQHGGRFDFHDSVRVHEPPQDRKSTRLNSSHGYISYAVFCLKKKKKYTSVDHTQHTGLTTFYQFHPQLHPVARTP